MTYGLTSPASRLWTILVNEAKPLSDAPFAQPMEGWVKKWLSWAFLATAVAVHCVFLSSLWTGVLNSLFYDTNYLLGQGADFFSYYQAGSNVLNGLDCYAHPSIPSVPYFYTYRYLPYFAYSFGVVFNIMAPIPAYWLWVGIVIVFLWLAVFRTRLLAKELQRPDWEGRMAMGMWLVFSPVYIELYLGQVTLFAGVLVFFALTTRSLVKGEQSRWAMTILWVAGGLMKLIPFLAAPALAAAGRLRSVLAAAAVMVLAIVLVPRGLEALDFFLTFNTARTIFVSGYVGSHSLNMLIYYLLGGSVHDFSFITALLMMYFLLPAVVVTLTSRDVWSCVSLFLVSYFFITTDVWEHHYTMLLPLLVLAWIRGRPEDKARWVPLFLALVLSLPALPVVQFLSGVGSGAHPITLSPAWQIIYHSSKVVPALIFYVWLILTAIRLPRDGGILDCAKEVFKSAWDNLAYRRSPVVVSGVMAQSEGMRELDAISNHRESEFPAVSLSS
jgi:hypothetical protein